MRDDVRKILERTLEEIKSGARTLDPVDEIDIALTAAGFQIWKVTRQTKRKFGFPD